MKNKNRLFSGVGIFLTIFIMFFPNTMYASTLPTIDADEAIVVNANDGSVVYSKNADEVHGIASITKLMTAYVAVKKAESQGIKFTDSFPMTYRASALKGVSSDASGVWYNEGQERTFKQILDFALIYSDNGAAIELAELTSGTEEKHVEDMNKQAEAWGLDKTKFYNVSGLTMKDYGPLQLENSNPNDYNVSTARQLAKMVFEIYHEYPEILDITSQSYIEYNGETLPSYNLMLPELNHEYKGVKGLKTGSSDEAGYCFAGFYDGGDDKQYITVVLGAKDTDDRFNQTAVLLDWVQTQKFKKIYTEENVIDFNIDGDFAKNIKVHPMDSLETLYDDSVNVYLEEIDYNDKYFNNGKLKQDIPAGERIFSARLKVITDNTKASSISDEAGYITIPFDSDSDIKYQGKIIDQTLGFLSYFESFVKSVL